MRVRVLLGGPLTKEVDRGAGERDEDLPDGACVGDVLRHLGVENQRVKFVLVNGRGATLDTSLEEGDRVALFPPELSFNTFVSLSFRRERVEARQRAQKTEIA
jgi:molybdopterin converting factor small subunit